MELLIKSREELWGYAKRLKLDPPKNIKDDDLRNMVEVEAIRQTEVIKQKERLILEEQSRMNRDIAEIQAEAALRGIPIDIPKEPTLVDIARLRKELNIMKNEPKPSPETMAIEGGVDPKTGKTIPPSKKVYAVFHNREQEDMDVTINPGGKYWFHLWPEKVHVLPEWLIGWLRITAVHPVYDKKAVPNPQAVKTGGTIEKSVKIASKPRFLFEKLGDAPANASFGVVLDEEILSKLTTPIM